MHAPIKKLQQGFTLIELMVAMLIGVFLIGGALEVFINTKQTNRMLENISRLQENIRFAFDFLGRDIRMTGYWGCMLPTTPNNDVTGTEGASGAPDSLTLRGAFVSTPVGSCSTAVVATDAIYTDTTSVITYSLVDNALRRATNNVNTANADLVEDIEDMQILYGVDTDADTVANYYVPYSSVATPANVVSVRITLTARSADTNLSLTGDGRIRRTFTSTIVLRNRIS